MEARRQRSQSSARVRLAENREHAVWEPAGVALPAHIVAGPDGNLWFTNAANDSVGRITPSGDVTTYSGLAAGVKEPGAITAGPDQNLWFTSLNNRIGRITTAGEIATYEVRRGRPRGLFGIAAGPDGNIWFTSNADGRVGFLRPSDAQAT
jgi:streptogramin lyase